VNLFVAGFIGSPAMNFVLAGGKSLWTARVSSRSAARSGQPLELAVDTTRLHFFDPASGQSIGHPLATGAEVSESASMR
jgi:multiple sugar transport system ATP-binding protein